jgi:hypothetical protein
MGSQEDDAMSRQVVQQYIGQNVVFMYDGKQREVNAELLKDTNAGAVLLVGRDAVRNHQYRSFDITKITGLRLA